MQRNASTLTAAPGAITSILAFAEERSPGARARIEHAFGNELRPDANGRVSADAIPRVLAEAARIVGDPALGLHLAEAGDPRRFGVISYACSASQNLGEAYAQIIRFLGLWNEGVELELALPGDAPALAITPRGRQLDPRGDGVRQLLMLSSATLVRIARLFTGETRVARALELATAEPLLGDELARFFACPVRVGVAETRILLEPAALALPLQSSDPVLAAIVREHAEAMLAELTASRAAWTARVREAVLADLGRGTSSLREIARKLGLSERTLQRRIGDEGESFQTIVDDARRRLALRYLRDARVSLSEIAYLLGFADLSAFYRAFKRWTGKTPSMYRDGA